MLALICGCPNDVPGQSGPAPAATNPPGTNPPGGGTNDAGADAANAGRQATPENWRGFVEVRIEETPDPNDNNAYVAAEALLLDPAQTDEEKAVHKGEFEAYQRRRVNVPKGTCVARAPEPEIPHGKPRYADVGDVKINKDGADLLTLERMPDGTLKYAQTNMVSAPATLGLSLKYWVSDLGIQAAFGNISKPDVTAEPAADGEGRIHIGNDASLRLLFNFARAGYSQATLFTSNPSGPFYTCYGDDDGKITISSDVLGKFKDVGEGIDFMLGIEHFFTDFFSVSNNTDIGTKFSSVDDFHHFGTSVSWGTSFHFYF